MWLFNNSMYKLKEVDVIKRCIELFHTYNLTTDHLAVCLIDDFNLSALRWHSNQFLWSFLLMAEHKGLGRWDAQQKIFVVNKELLEFKDLIT